MEKAIIFDWVGTLYKFNSDGGGFFDYSEKVVSGAKHRGYKIAVLSRVDYKDIEKRKKQISKLEDYIDWIIIDTYKSQKQFMECIEQLHSKPKNTVVVGDRAYSEIRIGNIIGCKTAWIQNGKYASELPNKKSGKPTYIIDSAKDLLEVL